MCTDEVAGLFDGNPDNDNFTFTLLNKYPTSNKLGGTIGLIRPHVWYLLRGETYRITGKDFWRFGGTDASINNAPAHTVTLMLDYR